MKKTAIALGTLLLAGTLPQSVLAGGCFWEVPLEIGAEALYWKSCSCEWDYAVTIGVSPNDAATFLAVKPDYEWGFRIFGGTSSCDGCSFLTLDWAYWRSTTTTTASDPNMRLTIPTGLANLTKVRARERAEFNRVNLRGGYYLYRGCDLQFYTYAGVRWIDIDNKRSIKVLESRTGTAGSAINSRSQFWGVGIEVGAGASYHIGCNVHLVTNIGGTTALGKRKFNYRRHLTSAVGARPFTFINPYPTHTVCVPGVDVRLGISYTYDCSCISLTGEIGYEHMTYFSVLTLETVDNENPRVFKCWDFGLGGPYASLKLRF